MQWNCMNVQMWGCENVFLNSISMCIISQNLEGHSLHRSVGLPASLGPKASTVLCRNENIAECYLDTITYIGSMCINTITQWGMTGDKPKSQTSACTSTHFFLLQCFSKHTHTHIWQKRRYWEMSKNPALLSGQPYGVCEHVSENVLMCVCMCMHVHLCDSGLRNVRCLFTKQRACEEAKCLNSMCSSQFKCQSSVCLPDTSWACARNTLAQQARSTARSDALAEVSSELFRKSMGGGGSSAHCA